MGVPGAQMWCHLCGDTETCGKEQRADGRSGTVGPWMEPTKWGLEEPESRYWLR